MLGLDRLGGRLLATSLKATLGLPAPLLRRVAGAPRLNDEGDPLDLQVQAMLRLDALRNTPGFPELGAARARVALRTESRAVAEAPRPVKEVATRTLPGRRGNIPARFYHPAAHGPRPVLVYYHGGGFVLGDLEAYDAVCRGLCDRTGALVISVDYRLAPEHPFPAAVDDAVDAYKWVRVHAPELGADPDRVAVGGDSAGGNLAAVVSQVARDEGLPLPRFQLLIYPATDMRRQTASHANLSEGYFLTRADMDWFLGSYLPGPEALTDPRASPLLAKDLSGLPPAHVVTAGFDPLRDEGRAYAEALGAAGVTVTHAHHPGLIDGFASMGGVLRAAAEAVDRLGVVTAEALAKR